MNKTITLTISDQCINKLMQELNHKVTCGNYDEESAVDRLAKHVLLLCIAQRQKDAKNSDHPHTISKIAYPTVEE